VAIRPAFEPRAPGGPFGPVAGEDVLDHLGDPGCPLRQSPTPTDSTADLSRRRTTELQRLTVERQPGGRRHARKRAATYNSASTVWYRAHIRANSTPAAK
jgi:hypothetical protein